jgi:hypothetical protein
MEAQQIIRVVGYTTSAIVSVAGIAVISGMFMPNYVPGNFRVVVGIVLVLYGIYRCATLWSKQRHARRLEE